jgi:hypothetical protein
MVKRRHSYTENKITALLKDSSGNYLWIAFLGSGGTSTLYRTTIFNPSVKYFDVDITGDEITGIVQDSSYLYCVLDDDDYIIVRVSKSSPISGLSYISKPGAISESPIDLTIDSTNLYLLIPGIASGTNAKILKYPKSTLVLSDTYDLNLSGKDPIYNAKSITVDDNGNLWVVNYDSPSKLIKVWETSGGSYDYQSWTII